MSDDATRPAMHALFMQRAIELARKGWYTTRPNPRVGCVVVRRQRVIGQGWHVRAGENHAERMALEDARSRGESVQGASVYVTLEPCSHTGRTSPCTEALVEARVARVIVGSGDPNPQVDGRGIARLRDAGIDVVDGILAERCRALNPGFNQRMTTGRPWVRVKLAMTLDGRTAAANGRSQWITGDAARRDVHRLRAQSGAVIVGSGTQRADDPSLDARLPGEWIQPRPVVLDARLDTPSDARLLAGGRGALIYTLSDDVDRRRALTEAGANVVNVAPDGAHPDPDAVLADLGAREINEVLLESGPRLAGVFAESGRVDEYVIYMAPTLLGDRGRGLLQLPGIDDLDDARALTIESIVPVGRDWKITAFPARQT